jgi:uncharacterized protein with FMN-binding domain
VTSITGRTTTTRRATTTTRAPASKQAVTGPVVDTQYGPVQVRVTLQGGRIADVVALQLPSDRSRSVEISNYAAPRLHDEVLRAQTAQIDVSAAPPTPARATSGRCRPHWTAPTPAELAGAIEDHPRGVMRRRARS